MFWSKTIRRMLDRANEAAAKEKESCDQKYNVIVHLMNKMTIIKTVHGFCGRGWSQTSEARAIQVADEIATNGVWEGYTLFPPSAIDRIEVKMHKYEFE